uniref:Uncharacterized protein n=1 Tax=Anguilla anguilla TaxID=7936 RepID=A0A0E9T9Z0_ANGAN
MYAIMNMIEMRKQHHLSVGKMTAIFFFGH